MKENKSRFTEWQWSHLIGKLNDGCPTCNKIADKVWHMKPLKQKRLNNES